MNLRAMYLCQDRVVGRVEFDTLNVYLTLAEVALTLGRLILCSIQALWTYIVFGSQETMGYMKAMRIHWRTLVFLLTPLVFLPIALVHPTQVRVLLQQRATPYPCLLHLEENGWMLVGVEYVRVRCLYKPAPVAVLELIKYGCKRSLLMQENNLPCTAL